jgi:stage II sporulation protein P
VGTTNPNYEVNEKLANKIDDISDKLYPCMSRGIYKRETKGWTDAYNQDINEGGMLIEVGAKENTIDEVLNTVDALSNVLNEYIKGE